MAGVSDIIVYNSSAVGMFFKLIDEYMNWLEPLKHLTCNSKQTYKQVNKWTWETQSDLKTVIIF